MITKEQLTALASTEARYVVSIYIPTHVKSEQVQQDPIRLKNALAAVKEQLVNQGHRRPDVEAVLDPANRLCEDLRFWRQQSQGLAIFAAPGLFQHHKLPIEVREISVVAPRAHIKPMLRLLADDGRYHILAVSAGAAKFYEATRFGLNEMDIDLPASVAEISAETNYQNMRHAAPPARPRSAGPVGMPATHNFGEDPEEQRKTQLIEYLRRVHNALEDHVGGTPTPIVLVAHPEVRGHLLALAKTIAFFGEGLQVDPGSLSEEELHERTYELVKLRFAQRRADDLDRFRMLAGSGDGRASDDLRTIVSAARFGRVDTLFVVQGQSVWGRHDEAADEVRLDPESAPENEDLLSYAAVQTLLQGGNVHVLTAEEMPRQSAMAAIFRF